MILVCQKSRFDKKTQKTEKKHLLLIGLQKNFPWFVRQQKKRSKMVKITLLPAVHKLTFTFCLQQWRVVFWLLLIHKLGFCLVIQIPGQLFVQKKVGVVRYRWTQWWELAHFFEKVKLTQKSNLLSKNVGKSVFFRFLIKACFGSMEITLCN